MQLTVVNLSTSPVPCPGAVSCAAGETLVLANRTVEECAQMTEQYAGSNVQVNLELEAEDYPPIVSAIKTPADPGSGVGSVAACGFDLETLVDGTAVAYQPTMYFGAFDDEDFTIPAANATLDTAAAGTIDSGAGTNLLEVTPSVTGELSVTLTDAEDETVYLKAWVAGSRRIIDTSQSHPVPFIP